MLPMLQLQWILCEFSRLDLDGVPERCSDIGPHANAMYYVHGGIFNLTKWVYTECTP